MMSGNTNIETQEDLLRAIHALEQSRAEAALGLEERASDLLESLKPVNLLKGALRDMVESEEVKQRLLAIGVGFAAGHVAKFIYKGRSDSKMKEFLGSMLQVGITTYVSGKPEAVQRVGGKALQALRLAMVDDAEPA